MSIMDEYDDIVIGKYGDDDDLWCKEGARVIREWLPGAIAKEREKANMEGFTEGCEVQWHEYALEADDKLSPGALRIKRGLLKIVAKAQRDMLMELLGHSRSFTEEIEVEGNHLGPVYDDEETEAVDRSTIKEFIDKLNKVIEANQ